MFYTVGKELGDQRLYEIWKDGAEWVAVEMDGSDDERCEVGERIRMTGLNRLKIFLDNDVNFSYTGFIK